MPLELLFGCSTAAGRRASKACASASAKSSTFRKGEEQDPRGQCPDFELSGSKTSRCLAHASTAGPLHAREFFEMVGPRLERGALFVQVAMNVIGRGDATLSVPQD